MSTAWSTTSITTSARKRPRSSAPSPAPGATSAMSPSPHLALPPHQLAGEDGDEHGMTDGGRRRSAPCPAIRCVTGQVAVPNTSLAHVPAEGEDHEDAPPRITRNARLPAISPSARRATASVCHARARAPNARGTGTDTGPRPLGLHLLHGVALLARPPGPGVREAEAATEQHEHGRDPQIHSSRFHSSIAGKPISRVLCCTGVQYRVSSSSTATPNGSASAAAVRLAMPSASGASRLTTNRPIPARNVGSICRASAATVNRMAPPADQVGEQEEQERLHVGAGDERPEHPGVQVRHLRPGREPQRDAEQQDRVDHQRAEEAAAEVLRLAQRRRRRPSGCMRVWTSRVAASPNSAADTTIPSTQENILPLIAAASCPA